ncbi:FMN-dependent alpha-hydroxy acid dehydrogenase [Annulohypoxylon truncatum]|uniref:FMN-dependent alpha-hydroxy acid dehydrogenase n=1 Tax=Annulohypoxylon truncatum TaxID=327061 RepID=UPI002008AC87|nr:FMN-dependent alpha-hydroxy acid dehydrogenase [Annulohypoxylon truncatum]KAI1206337.1 FMN-dependent alpha-hydroxy acid dehydrogenase [Annulohypoxylon truncatum]
MSNPNNPNIQQRSTPQWGLYQRELFWAPNENKHPPFNTDPDKLRATAKERLSQAGWHYASCNAGQSLTHYANRAAFYRHQIIPRTLVDTTARDTLTSIFSHQVSAPIGFAPIGINRIYHATGELSPAKVAGELGLLYCLSSAGSYSIEDVARANDAGAEQRRRRSDDGEKVGAGEGGEVGGARWFQLYWSPDEAVALSMLKRAADNGYAACVLTTDTWQLGWRHDDVAHGNYAFYHEHGAGDLGLRDPVFADRVSAAGLDPAVDKMKVGASWIDGHIWHGQSFAWDKIPWLIQNWKRLSGGKPFAIKGIQSVADARKAVELGVDGIVVSNHAGRQVDGAVASLDALERIVDAVGDRIYIMYDSGVRSGADVFKALALGAKFVFVGRLWVYALGSGGEEGVRHVMKSLLADFDILMNVAGYPDLKEINRDALDSLPKGSCYPPTTEMA